MIKLSDLNFSMPNTLWQPQTPGIGEVWADTQFEGVSGKSKFGTATQIDASNWTIKQKIKGVETNMNNPHNLWSDPAYKYIYQTEWFDKKLTTFDRVNGKVYNTQVVGANSACHVQSADRHALRRPERRGPGAQARARRVPDGAREHQRRAPLRTGEIHDHPETRAPSASVVDLSTEQITEIPTGGIVPIAVWSGKDHKAYVANLLGTPPAMLSSLTVIDINTKKKLKDINLAEDYNPLSGEHKGEAYGLGPIQTPVSPDGKYVVTANFLSSTITILDTKTDKVVKSLPCEPGCHGANFGLKQGGGY